MDCPLEIKLHDGIKFYLISTTSFTLSRNSFNYFMYFMAIYFLIVFPIESKRK